MNLRGLQRELAERRVRLTVVRGALKWRAPRAAMTGRLATEVSSQKPALIESILAPQRLHEMGLLACWLCWELIAPERVTCGNCLALAPGLTEQQMDAVIYGPGNWLC